MADFTALTCPSCGGKLENTKDVDRLICGYCGNTHIARRNDVSERTASELAIDRLQKEIASLKNSRNLLVTQSKVDISKSDVEILSISNEIDMENAEIESAKYKIESNSSLLRTGFIRLPVLSPILIAVIYFGIKYDGMGLPIHLLYICLVFMGLIVFVAVTVSRYAQIKKERLKITELENIKKQKSSQLINLSKGKTTEHIEAIQHKIADIDKQITFKQSELDKHYKIVSGNP